MSYSNDIGNLQHSSINTPINQSGAVSKPQVETSGTAVTSAGLAKANSSAAQNDQASLSPASTLLVQALNVSDVRTEKVASLQQAIASGSYHVASADVADKLLHSLLG